MNSISTGMNDSSTPLRPLQRGWPLRKLRQQHTQEGHQGCLSAAGPSYSRKTHWHARPTRQTHRQPQHLRAAAAATRQSQPADSQAAPAGRSGIRNNKIFRTVPKAAVRNGKTSLVARERDEVASVGIPMREYRQKMSLNASYPPVLPISTG